MRLIDADAFIDEAFERYCKDCDRRKGVKNGKYRIIYSVGDAPCRACSVDDMKDDIDSAPTIDAAPVVHGEWEDDDILKESRCSACGEVSSWFDSDIEYWNYCPYCGAKMDGGKG